MWKQNEAIFARKCYERGNDEIISMIVLMFSPSPFSLFLSYNKTLSPKFRADEFNFRIRS
jgi:hypothetical protein